MMKLVTTEAVTHIHTHGNLIKEKIAENKAALFWIY